MDSAFGRKDLEGKRFKLICLEGYGRTGTVLKQKKQGRLTVVFDDKPGVKDIGYLDEEIQIIE